MARPNNNDDLDLYRLLERADELLEEDDDRGDLLFPQPEFDEETEVDEAILYRNAANGYGAAVPPAQTPPPQPAAPAPKPTQAEKAAMSIRAYNADFRHQRQRSPKPAKPAPPEAAPIPVPSREPSAPKKRKSGCLKKLLFPAVFILALAVLFHMVITPPRTDAPVADRRSGVSAILLCGADIGGDRTDTMMLLYVDGVKGQAGLLTLPRDTYTLTDYGDDNKLNSAYGRNGKGEEGMAVLFDYVQDTIGYRPDGYVLIELPMLRDLIDLFGGVEFHVPQTMNSQGISGGVHLEEGLQHLTGEEALGLLRFRFGYADQDLGRQNVHKDFIKACMEQWFRFDNLGKLPEVLELFKIRSLTDLDTGNFLWFGWNLLKVGFSNIYTDTLPGYATMVGDQSYYVLFPDEVAQMVQDRYNPYKTEITRQMLDIATE